MIGVIPNPKKTLQVEKPSSEVKTAIEHLYLYSPKYKVYKANPVMSQYIYDASEFLSLGVYIDISYLTVSENRTEVTIEVRRKMGSFDKSHEVTLANSHIQAIAELISTTLGKDHSEALAAIAKVEDGKKQKADALKQQIEENKRKAREERASNPVKYYTKQAAIIVFGLGGLAAIWYFVIKALISK